jgi:hypothetical protein
MDKKITIEQYRRDQMLARKYGIDEKDVAYMLLEQRERCAICFLYIGGVTIDKNGVERTDAHIDHDHKTGELRELLCTNCNKGLGCFKDDPRLLERAAEYLKKHGTKPGGASVQAYTLERELGR